MINPNIKTQAKHRIMPSTTEMVQGILAGDRNMLSQAITLVESKQTKHRLRAIELLSLCRNQQKSSFRIGITGVPGVGKSTFIENFGQLLVAKQHKVAVLAIDPTSAKTSGSILGDKTRMASLSANDAVFIRPTAAGTTLGGVAGATREAILLCEMAGFDMVLVETVGVGQSEIEVHQLVDCFLLLLLAGAGDELQGIKRGIMEMADVLTITKAEGENQLKAKQAKTALQQAIKFFPPHTSGWKPPVLQCSALANIGINEIYQNLMAFRDYHLSRNLIQTKRAEQNKQWFEQAMQIQIQQYWAQQPTLEELYQKHLKAVSEGSLLPPIAAYNLFTEWITSLKTKA